MEVMRLKDKFTKRSSIRVRYQLVVDTGHNGMSSCIPSYLVLTDMTTERELSPSSRVIDAFPRPPAYRAPDCQLAVNKHRSVDSGVTSGTPDRIFAITLCSRESRSGVITEVNGDLLMHQCMMTLRMSWKHAWYKMPLKGMTILEQVVGPVSCYVATYGKYCTLTILHTPLQSSQSDMLLYLFLNYMITMYLYVLLYMSNITFCQNNIV